MNMNRKYEKPSVTMMKVNATNLLAGSTTITDDPAQSGSSVLSKGTKIWDAFFLLNEEE